MSMTMIGFEQPFKLNEGNLFKTYKQDKPMPQHNELLIKVHSISVNPVDTKQRLVPVSQKPRVLGFDAVGIIEAIGPEVTMFKVGDKVFYSGVSNLNGSNATYQIMPEVLVAKAPTTLSDEQSASLPLTGLTAYETLFDTFGISTNPMDNNGKTLLIINGAGGVGSIATQIAKRYGLTVVTTASRTESMEWSKQMGADFVLNHKEDLKVQFKERHIDSPDYIFCTFNSDMYYDTMIDLVKPRGHITTIVAFENNQDLNALKGKSITFSHEFMFTRPLYQTTDMIKLHDYLQDIATNIDEGNYQPTTTQVIDGLTTDNIYRAHQILENQSMIGKLVINVNK